MIDRGTFYGILVASSTSLLGIGAGIFATRIVSLMERAFSVKREQEDLLNDLGQGPERRWRLNSRQQALADLNQLAKELRPTVIWPLVWAVAIVVLSMPPLFVTRLDSAEYRVTLVILFVLAALGWLWLLLQLVRRLFHFTLGDARKQRDRDATVDDAFKVAIGGKLSAGSYSDLRELARELKKERPELLKGRKGKRYLHQLRRWKKPIV